MRCITKIILLILVSIFQLNAQVKINSKPDENGSVLDLQVNSKGFLPTRISRLARTNMKDNSAFLPIPRGLVVYDTDDQLYYYYNPNNSVNGIENWQAIGAFLFKDDQANQNGGIYYRDIETHRSVKGVSLFNNTTTSTNRNLHIKGKVSVASDNTLPSGDYGLHVAENSAFVGNMQVGGDFGAGLIEGPGTVPLGAIIMWAGSSVPDGFVLCYGGTSNGFNIPDLRNKFIMGYSSAAVASADRGSNFVTLTSSNLPSHSHKMSDFLSTFSTSEAPAHRHLEGQNAEFGTGDYTSTSGDRNTGDDTDRVVRYHTSTEPDHTHTIRFNGVTGNSGLSTPNSIDNRPNYYALAFIMRVY